MCIGVIKNCSDGKPCTADSCDDKTGDCSHDVAPPGMVCGPGLVCLSGGCKPAGVGWGRNIAANIDRTCAIRVNGTTACWGKGQHGKNGNGSQSTTKSPTSINGLSGVTALAVGRNHTCAVSDGALWCWGRSMDGQTGLPTTQMVLTPQKVPGLQQVTSVAAGLNHTCVVAKGQVHCFGYNDAGQVGVGKQFGKITTPQAVPGTQGTQAVSCGIRTSCALAVGGTAMCWGANSYGQAGVGNTNDTVLTPKSVKGLEGIVQVVGADMHHCALKSDGTIWCWGVAGSGQLGIGASTTPWYHTPQAVVGLNNVALIDAAGHHTCAVQADGALWCWGTDLAGQPGGSKIPSKVGGLPSIIDIGVGDFHSCAIDGKGKAWCWGSNLNGQLGLGTSGKGTNKPSPTAVPGT